MALLTYRRENKPLYFSVILLEDGMRYLVPTKEILEQKIQVVWT